MRCFCSGLFQRFEWNHYRSDAVRPFVPVSSVGTLVITLLFVIILKLDWATLLPAPKKKYDYLLNAIIR